MRLFARHLLGHGHSRGRLPARSPSPSAAEHPRGCFPRSGAAGVLFPVSARSVSPGCSGLQIYNRGHDHANICAKNTPPPPLVILQPPPDSFRFSATHHISRSCTALPVYEAGQERTMVRAASYVLAAKAIASSTTAFVPMGGEEKACERRTCGNALYI